jgi:hypothetical protein
MPSNRRRFAVGGVVVAVGIVALYAWPRSVPEVPQPGSIVVRQDPPAASPGLPLAPEPAASPTRSAIEAAILESVADPHAELRKVVVRRDAPQIACGEKRTSRDPVFRRFVWLGHLKMLATDDGSQDFGNIATVCNEGQPVP